MSAKTISAAELDRMFDDGEDIDEYMDWTTIRRPGRETTSVVIDFPDAVFERLEAAAQAQGVTRQVLLQMWIKDRLDRAA